MLYENINKGLNDVFQAISNNVRRENIYIFTTENMKYDFMLFIEKTMGNSCLFIWHIFKYKQGTNEKCYSFITNYDLE